MSNLIAALSDRVKSHQPVRLVEWERAKKDPVDHAEDRRRQTDSEGERDDGREVTLGVRDSVRTRVAQILKGLLHRHPPPRGASVLDDRA